MALTLPDTEALNLFAHETLEGLFSEEFMEQAIQQAADLLWLATRVSEDPEDETVARIVNWGILDMAWSLLIKTEHKDEIYGPYQTERIGSYSYSKASQQIRAGDPTGVGWFDSAIALLMGDAGLGAIWSATEHVFEQPYTATQGTTPDAYRHDWFGS